MLKINKNGHIFRANRKSEAARGGRGKGKGKKPANASLEGGRQTTMKTRSGGKPPTTSYAAKFATAYSLEISAERIGGQRVRGKGSKGFFALLIKKPFLLRKRKLSWKAECWQGRQAD